MKPSEFREFDVMFQTESVLDPIDRAGGTRPPGLAYWSIVQLGAGMDKTKIPHVGEFCTTTPEGEFEFRPELHVIVLQSGPCNTRFEAGQVVCKSYDGIYGPHGQLCKECAWFAFRKSDIPASDKCRGSRLLLCVDAEDPEGDCFFVRLSASGIRDWNDYASWLQDQKHRPVFACTTRILTTSRKQGKGVPYVPVFRPTKALDLDMLKVMRSRRLALQHHFYGPDALVAEKPEPTDSSGEYLENDFLEGYEEHYDERDRSL